MPHLSTAEPPLRTLTPEGPVWSRALGEDGAGFFHLSDPFCGCGRAQLDEIKHPREVVGEISGEDRFVVGDTVPQSPDASRSSRIYLRSALAVSWVALGNSDKSWWFQIRTSWRAVNMACQNENFNSATTFPVVC